jgi:phosphatidylserine decarboxylase
MKALHRSAPFLRAYAFLPHRWMNRATARFTAARRPAWAVRAAIRAWQRAERIDLADFEPGPFASLDDFFLRRLQRGARPLSRGFVAPADGRLVARGSVRAAEPLVVKGQRLSVERVVNAGVHGHDLRAYEGGEYAVIFLTPRGYHRVHAPTHTTVVEARWIPGRYFPQNADALEHIPRVYERNERVVLSCRGSDGEEFLLVLVGASLIGGIRVEGVDEGALRRRGVVTVNRTFAKGDELGHFAFGSTVVVLLPRGQRTAAPSTPEVKMGDSLWY